VKSAPGDDRPRAAGEDVSSMTAERYELVLRGEIGDRFGLLFEGMLLKRIAGRTVMTGDVRDQSHLHGLIEQIQELGLELVSVNPLDEGDVR
jgi:hypothetical protein